MASQLFNLKRYFGAADQDGHVDTVQDNGIGNDENVVLPSQQPIAPPMEPAKRQDLSLLTHFSQRLNIVIAQAATEATNTRQAFIEPEHLLLGLLYDSGVFKIISDMAVASPTSIQEALKKNESLGTFSGTPQFSNTTKAIFEKAAGEAKVRSEEFITPEHVLFALIEHGNSKASQILTQNNITKSSIERKLTTNQPLGKPTAASALETYGVDLTKKARENHLDPVVDREKEIERAIHILSRRTKNNPVLVGEAGVGKTAIVEGLSQKIVNGEVPVDLRNKRIVGLDLTSLVAGASHRGEFEERLKRLIKELQVAQGEVILFIDEIHNLVGAGSGEGTLDASNILKPFLARGEIQLIGTSTIDEYRRYIEKDPALERRFQQVLIEEPSIELAIEMLKGVRSKYEDFHKVQITDEAIDGAVKLSKQYIGDRFLPDKAVDLIDEAASKRRLSQKDGGTMSITADDIEEIVASWTGIPVAKLTETESDRLLNLEKLIHQRLIDQEGAVTAVAEAVRRGRAGLKSTNRPIGSFLFLGPTGVGKTELAKTLAEVLFGSETLMIRLDMSEYMEKHEVAKLIGAPPGYVGYEEGGQLTEAVRTKPYCVILLDEVEKAHPDVFNILIQILEDGRLTDNKGRTVSFKNAIIIATSNIGTGLIQKQDVSSLGEQALYASKSKKESHGNDSAHGKNEAFATLTDKLLSELQKFFKPELLNRFDEIIVFKPLSQEHMREIATIGIANTKKLLEEKKIDLEISQNALDELAHIGFDPLFGARPLRRAIQTRIENPISTLLIQKAFQEGNTILVDFDAVKSEFSFSKKQLRPNVPPQQPTLPSQNQNPNPFAGLTQSQPPPPQNLTSQPSGDSSY